MADEVWLDVLPSMRGFAGTLTKEVTKAAKDAGDKGGKEYKKALEKGADGSGDALVAELETAQKRAAGLVAKLSGEVSRARQSQARASAELLTAEQRVTDATAKYGEESNQARAAVLKLEAAKEKATQATQTFTNAENALKEGQKSLKETTTQLTDAQQKSGTEATKSKSIWEKLTGSQRDNETQTDRNTGSIGSLIAKFTAATGAAALLAAAFGTALTEETVGDRLAAQLDATPVQAQAYGEAAGSLWANAYGDSIGEVGDAVDSIVSSIDGMRDASTSSIEDITGKALSLSDAFGIDVTESARNAGILIKTGLASDAEDAFDLMTASLQQVPAALRGEVTDATQEYSDSLAQLGLSGEEAMGLLVSATENGQYGVDKMGDALKELTIRSSDMSTSSVAAYKAAGLSAQDMSDRFLAGGDVARGALADLVTGLQSITDPAAQANASIALFGTPLEDLGTGDIPSFLDQLATMGGALGDVSGSAEDLSNTLYDNTSTSLESLKRGFSQALSEGIEPFLGPADEVLGWVQDVLPGIQDVISILFNGDYTGGLADSFGIYEDSGFVDFLFSARDAAIELGSWLKGTLLPALESFGSWLTSGSAGAEVFATAVGAIVAGVITWTAVTRTATAVQAAFAVVMDANPIMLIVTAIAALVAGLVYFFTQTETGRQLWETFTTALADGWNWVVGVVQAAWTDVLKPTWDALVAAATWLWESVLSPIFDAISFGWSLLATGFQFYWDYYLSPMLTIFAATISWLWDTVAKPVWDVMKIAWGVLVAGITWYWDHVLSPMFDAAGTVISWLWNNVAKPVWDKMKSGWNTLVGGITDIWDNKLKPAFDALKSFIDTTLPDAFEAGKDAIGSAWNKIKGLAAKPINFVIDTVYNNGFRSVINKVAGWVGAPELPSLPTIPEYAKGGLAGTGWAVVGEQGPELVNFDKPGRVYTAGQTATALAGAVSINTHTAAAGPVAGATASSGSAYRTLLDVAAAGSTRGAWPVFTMTASGTPVIVSSGGGGKGIDPTAYVKYDNGGVLQPGATGAVNATGRPEAVLTEAQWTSIERIADNAGLSLSEIDLSDRTLRKLAQYLLEADERAVARGLAKAAREAQLVTRMGGA
ncbi:phage tail tape measure protein [Demequina capsici]|uniref:Phage tail tape measure protein n=1 Tax=Demequina capsici TaxID=3075620 RepID=A0AA96JD16_9MICO|nr:phage tail tape measure protein [Demequina sp. PMTSA13]WNM27556.1 phage tail tape measure protein [Demequina sp. PMTSA13]